MDIHKGKGSGVKFVRIWWQLIKSCLSRVLLTYLVPSKSDLQQQADSTLGLDLAAWVAHTH